MRLVVVLLLGLESKTRILAASQVVAEQSVEVVPGLGGLRVLLLLVLEQGLSF